jgi:hypothetical protein
MSAGDLNAKLNKLLEFFFGDVSVQLCVMRHVIRDVVLCKANLSRDKWLKKEIESAPDGFVELAKLMKFNTVSALTSNAADLIAAVKSLPELLALSDDNARVKRIVPLPAKVSLAKRAARTVMIDNLGDAVTVEMLEQRLQQFGKPAYISIPRRCVAAMLFMAQC